MDPEATAGLLPTTTSVPFSMFVWRFVNLVSNFLNNFGRDCLSLSADQKQEQEQSAFDVELAGWRSGNPRSPENGEEDEKNNQKSNSQQQQQPRPTCFGFSFGLDAFAFSTPFTFVQ